MGIDTKATEIMNAYAAKGWHVFRTEVFGSHLYQSSLKSRLSTF